MPMEIWGSKFYSVNRVQAASGLSVSQAVKRLQKKKVVLECVKHKRNGFAVCSHVHFSLAQ